MSAERVISMAEERFEFIEHVAQKYVGAAPLECRARWLAFCERVAEHASGRSKAIRDDRDRLLPEFTD